MVFVPLFRPACIMSSVLRWTLAFVLLRIAFLISAAMLCGRKHRCAQQQSQY